MLWSKCHQLGILPWLPQAAPPAGQNHTLASGSGDKTYIKSPANRIATATLAWRQHRLHVLQHPVHPANLHPTPLWARLKNALRAVLDPTPLRSTERTLLLHSNRLDSRCCCCCRRGGCCRACWTSSRCVRRACAPTQLLPTVGLLVSHGI